MTPDAVTPGADPADPADTIEGRADGKGRRPVLAGLGVTLAVLSVAACRPVQPFGVSPASGRWSSVAGLNIPRDDFGLTAVGGRLFAIGGMTGARGNALDSVEVFDPSSASWSRAGRLGAPTSSLGAATLHERVYAVGGARDDLEVPLNWVWSPGPVSQSRATAWESAAPLLQPRLGHGLAALSGRLYVAGGLHRGEATATMEAYDPQRDRWSAVAPLPEPRFNLGLVALGGRLYAIGGSGTDRRPAASLFHYDPVADRWRTGTSMPEALSNFGVAPLGDRRIHALHHRTHLVFDATPERWLRATPMPTSRHGLGLIVLAGALYAIGGCSEEPQRDLPTVEVFRPAV
ncbi:MAG: hypothetical protein M3442_13020 [Chloroflexota bacterium]|nr:hypothetical protein [Chloroflexota bacterium]